MADFTITDAMKQAVITRLATIQFRNVDPESDQRTSRESHY